MQKITHNHKRKIQQILTTIFFFFLDWTVRGREENIHSK